MAGTFGDVMKANRQKRVAVIIKSKGLPQKKNFEDYSGGHSSQINPMRQAVGNGSNQYGSKGSTDKQAKHPVGSHVAHQVHGERGQVVAHPESGKLLVRWEGGKTSEIAPHMVYQRNTKVEQAQSDSAAKENEAAHREEDPLKDLAKPPKDIELGFAFDETNPKSVAAIQDHAAGLITGVSNTTRTQIRDLVEEAFTDPEMDVNSLADAINDILDDPDRADLIARTETMQAANDGQLDAWDQAQQEGLLTGDEEKEWIATGDQRCCDACDSMDGETVGINEDFTVDGDDMPGPPAHPNCRCTVGINAGS